MTTPCTRVLATRRFVLIGKLPFSPAQLESIIQPAQLSSIAVHANKITVGIRGIANARQIEGGHQLSVSVRKPPATGATTSTSLCSAGGA